MTISQNLKKSEFNRLSLFIESEYGIKMPIAKKTMLESRLQKRLRQLQMKNYGEYCEYLFSPEGRKAETPYFVDKVTTNKTDFFREPEHFTRLTQAILPDLLSRMDRRQAHLRLWSAGCSSGEEAYTLAMVLMNYAENNPETPFTFSILATDISEEVMLKGRLAVYDSTRVEPVPMALRRKYLLKSKDRRKSLVRLVPEIRRLVEFQRLNLMDRDFGLKQDIHIAFCRNVIIYFNKATQESILSRIIRYLVPGGYLFQGHSESIHGMDLPVQGIYPTIFQKLQ